MSVCFAVVLVLFVFAPSWVAELMIISGGIVGLEGNIVITPWDLDHILTLSLMATITVLAAGTAIEPEETVPFLALAVAKAVSTAGFFGLAIQYANTWYIGAIADGTVLLGLVWLRYRMWQIETRASIN